jgi:hypothetical protein
MSDASRQRHIRWHESSDIVGRTVREAIMRECQQR